MPTHCPCRCSNSVTFAFSLFSLSNQLVYTMCITLNLRGDRQEGHDKMPLILNAPCSAHSKLFPKKIRGGLQLANSRFRMWHHFLAINMLSYQYVNGHTDLQLDPISSHVSPCVIHPDSGTMRRHDSHPQTPGNDFYTHYACKS
jgi:hypothetical protein